jgi:lysozyme
MINGIDVSHNNGNIDWKKVKTNPLAITFAFIKATQGVGYTDPKCKVNAQAASQAGIRFGYYHFSSLNKPAAVESDATDEANYFDQVLKTMPQGNLPPVLDIETNDKGLTTQQVQLWISTFMNRMKILGYPLVIIYSYKPFFDTNLPANHPFGSIPLWLAQYRNVAAPSLPRGWSKYLIWQYSAKEKVTGISTDCDINKADDSLLSL